MAGHRHGDMNTFKHEKTFEGFIKFMTRSIIVIALILVFLALVGS